MEANLPKAALNIVDNVLMKKIGTMAIMFIRRRTVKGEFLPGSSDNAGQYSTKPYVMPLGKASKSLADKFLKNKVDDVEVFTAKSSGKLWLWIGGGYKEFRRLSGKGSDHVDMNWTGRMMRNLGIIHTGQRETSLGFPLKEADEIAGYHNISGAGKSKRKHVFMGLTTDEKKQLEDFAGKEITERFIKNLG